MFLRVYIAASTLFDPAKHLRSAGGRNGCAISWFLLIPALKWSAIIKETAECCVPILNHRLINKKLTGLNTAPYDFTYSISIRKGKYRFGDLSEIIEIVEKIWQTSMFAWILFYRQNRTANSKSSGIWPALFTSVGHLDVPAIVYKEHTFLTL